MVEDIIQEVAERLSPLPCIEGVVLGGSRARGSHTEDSDIDIGIYYNPDSLDLDGINQVAAQLDDEHRSNLVVPPGGWGPWVNAGGWLVIGGYPVDLILRDINRVKQVMQDTEQGIVTTNYQPGHPHGYISTMYRGELAISKVLYSRNNDFYELKKRAEIYPIELQKAMLGFFMFEADFSLLHAKANAEAGDRYHVAGHIFRSVSGLNQVLFACNRAYCINEKRAVRLIDTLERKPADYSGKVNRIFAALGVSLQECCDLTEELYSEVKEIVAAVTNG
ncbi:MAG: nucleotidyltransferase domain-containing protein [Firmicutes bacterium]|nr:nucleotidyltransferase domain-containing protein [Bacillota bacterium]